MAKSIRVNLGGPGEAVETTIVVAGCPCRTEDFAMAIVAFANDWRRQADARPSSSPTPTAPCGCHDAQQR